MQKTTTKKWKLRCMPPRPLFPQVLLKGSLSKLPCKGTTKAAHPRSRNTAIKATNKVMTTKSITAKGTRTKSNKPGTAKAGKTKAGRTRAGATKGTIIKVVDTPPKSEKLAQGAINIWCMGMHLPHSINQSEFPQNSRNQLHMCSAKCNHVFQNLGYCSN